MVCSGVVICIAAPDVAFVITHFSIEYRFVGRMYNQIQNENTVASKNGVQTIVISSCVKIRIAAPGVTFIVTYFSRLRKFKSWVYNQVQDENAVAAMH
ncbi:hypothetical protein DSECCO2_495650 [anaerobic digester metagenome]